MQTEKDEEFVDAQAAMDEGDNEKEDGKEDETFVVQLYSETKEEIATNGKRFMIAGTLAFVAYAWMTGAMDWNGFKGMWVMNRKQNGVEEVQEDTDDEWNDDDE
eukprot:TRINITY_DN687_c0_g4_i1.p2 TRINITY_DN687_c0_g4~~TRINITY_DN687_c0_g4_i1.p2  ORF type:complete len:104 (+),score=49.36 TRINITY_DN687_c0_g4_i1:884-1195(+)